MSDVFKLSGCFSTTPSLGANYSGIASLEAPISEMLGLDKKSAQSLELTTNDPVVVAFGGLAAVNVLVVKAIGGKVRVRITSADGATQAIPVDSFLALITSSVPITAIDVTRVTGVSTTADVFLGERA